MLKFIEVTGKNEDEAIAKGLAQLGLDRDDVSLEILERGKTGFLGIGSVPAKVKLTYEAPAEEEVVAAAAPVAPAAPAEAEEPEKEVEETSTPVEEVVDDEVAQAIVRFQSGLFAQMGVEASSRITRGSTTYTPVLVRKCISGFSRMARISPFSPRSTTP